MILKLFFKIKAFVSNQLFSSLGQLYRAKSTTLTTTTEQKRRKTYIYDKASKLYKDFLAIYFYEYYELSNLKRKIMMCGLNKRNRLIQEKK